MILTDKRGFEYGVQHFYSPRSGKLSEILSEVLATDPTSAQFLISFGCIYVKSQRTTEDVVVEKEDYIRAHTKPRRYPIAEVCPQPRLIFENDEFVVIHKDAQIPCHPTVDNLHENLLMHYQRLLSTELFLTHRLDVPTEGLLLFAKTLAFQKEFNQLIAKRSVKKIYQGVLSKDAPLGLWRHYMKPSPRAPKEVSLSPQDESWQLCELEVVNIKPRDDSHYIAEFNLLTGRTHQIRAQSAAMGAPLRGDALYGAAKIYVADMIDLCAVELSFTTELGESFSFKTKPRWS